MSEVRKRQIIEDYHEILSSDAGKRVLGSIFHFAGLNSPSGWKGADVAAYEAGRRDLALAIANTAREANVYAVATCEEAYNEFVKKYERSETDGEHDGDEYGNG